MQTTREHSHNPANLEEAEIQGKLSEDFNHKLKLQDHKREEEEEEVVEEEAEGEELEFTFAHANQDNSPISADDAFNDGHVRQFYPLFDRNLLLNDEVSHFSQSSLSKPPLKGLLIKERRSPDDEEEKEDELEGVVEGTYCVWRGRAGETEACKKSNSTGFSKLWRVRELVRRSTSDGKDTFVFLNPKSVTSKMKGNENETATAVTQTTSTIVNKNNNNNGKRETTTSANQGRKNNRNVRYGYGKSSGTGKEGGANRRKSYLPYRQDLVGFFTNSNGLSRNVHPF